MKRTLTVELGDRSYPVVVADSHQLAWVETLEPRVAGRRVAVITDETVARLYRADMSQALERCGAVAPSWHVVPPGEASKSMGVLQSLYDGLLATRFGRDGVIVALGGGVVGDLGGFAAATIHRGVSYVQAPTTLLAMVDSSVGGKTGVNHPLGKNLIGAFHQPGAVAANLATLKTLPARELAGGFAEIIKYGVIRDEVLFERLERHAETLLMLSSPHLLDTVLTSVRIKAEVVAEDERESGLRMILNYGHTLGHAIERTAGFGAWSHGQAVAVGMVLAAELGAWLGRTPPQLAPRIAACCTSFGLPVSIERAHRAVLADAVAHDKKVRGDLVHFVLPRAVGRVEVEPLPLSRLNEWLQESSESSSE